MLPILLVFLLAAQSAFGASVSVRQELISNVPRSNSIHESALELVDGGDKNVYMITLEDITKDLGNQPDASSQATAYAITLGILGELASGVAGDACEYANTINAYVGYLGSGNSAGLRNALGGLVGRLNGAIDSIAALATNPGSLRFSRGASGGCVGGGRSYNFEAAWESVLASAGINNAGLMNEMYCTSRRLYNAFNSRSNNVGAAATASALAPVSKVVGGAIGPIDNFLRAAIGGNAGAIASAAAAAKGALSNSLANAKF